MTISPSIPHAKISDLAASQYLGCAKHSVKSSITISENAYLASLSNPKDTQVNKKAHSVQNANFERGRIFEANLFATLQKKYPGKVHDHTDTPIEDSMKILENAKEGDILYQLGFVMPSTANNATSSFYTDKKIGDDYRLGKFVPDFLWIKKNPDTETLVIFVVDAKSSDKVAESYKFQVGSYAYLLEYLTKDMKNMSIDLYGGVWLPTNLDMPEIFRVDLMLPGVANYYTKDLVSTFKKDPKWIYNSKCKACPFSEQCTEELDMATGLFPYTDVYDFNDISDALRDIEDLMKVKESGSSPIVKFKEGSKYQCYLDAQRDEKPKLLGTRSLLMTENVSNSICISIVFNPLHKFPCAYAIQAQLRGTKVFQNFGRTLSNAETEHTDHLNNYKILAEHFVDDLAGILDRLDASGRHNEDCSIFVYYNASITRIEKWLYHFVSTGVADELSQDQKKTMDNAMKCLVAMFHSINLLSLPGATYLPIDDMDDRSCEVPLLSSVETILKETVALSIPGYYILPKAVAWMNDTPGKDMGVLDDDDIYMIWFSGENVGSMLKAQNTALHTIINKLRVMGDEYKAAHPNEEGVFPLQRPKFYWPTLHKFNSPIMARLSFFCRLECLRSCDNIRAIRLQDFRRKTSGTIVLKYKPQQTDGRFTGTFDVQDLHLLSVQEKLSKLDFNANLKPYLLVDDSLSGILDAIKFNDIFSKTQSIITRQHNMISGRGVGVERIKIQHRQGSLQLVLNVNSKGDWRENRKYRLYPRFKDYNTHKLFMALRDEDDDEDSMVEALLRDPNQWSKKFDASRISSKDIKAALKMCDSYAMTPAQKFLTEELLKKRLQIIFGPPGTGKTRFLGTFVNWYISQFHDRTQTKSPLIIAITAFTRNSIEELIMTIIAIHTRYSTDDTKSPFKIVHLTTAASRSPAFSSFLSSSEFPTEGVKTCKAEVYHNTVARMVKEDEDLAVIVVSGTVWDFEKVNRGADADWKGLNMLIIDESSQMLVAESVLAIRCLERTNGKLILAGDHLQLGPIIQHEYPTLSPKDPLFFGSIQQCLMRTRDNELISLKNLTLRKGVAPDHGPNTIQLSDNWRMNAELNSFFQHVYGENYKERFSSLRLEHDLSRLSKRSKHVQDALDSSKSITIVKVRPAPNANEDDIAKLEASVVYDIIDAHMDALEKTAAKDQPSSIREQFATMIVTPYHRQRMAIDELLKVEEYSNRLCVNTTEKMQGQQSDLVIACFTFKDLTNRKLNFILDFRRWNVALSRARCKVIVVTTDNVLKFEGRNYENQHMRMKDQVAAGWEFVRLIKDWATHKDAIVDWPTTS